MKKQLIGKIILGAAIVFAIVGFALKFGGTTLQGVNPDEVHNNLVTLVQEVMDKEQIFYDEYWVLVDEGDTSLFMKGLDDFDSAYLGLDAYMNDTDFSVEHDPVVKVYGEKYKPFMGEYLAYAQEFSDFVKKDGFLFEKAEPFLPKMQEFTDQFVDVNNELVLTMNSLIKVSEIQ